MELKGEITMQPPKSYLLQNSMADPLPMDLPITKISRGSKLRIWVRKVKMGSRFLKKLSSDGSPGNIPYPGYSTIKK